MWLTIVDPKPDEVRTGPGKEGHSTDDGDEAYPLLQLLYHLLIECPIICSDSIMK